MVHRDRSSGKGHYPLLDAGRGIAAIVVLVLHIGNEAGVHLVPRGYLAVDFFLLLSGFVVARAYEAKLADGRMTFAGFLGVRAARLYPVIFAAGVAASISLWVWPIPDWPPGPWLLRQFALIPSAVWLLFPANAPLWSLFYETLANIVHAAVLRRLPTAWLAILVATLVAAAIGYAARAGSYDVGFRPGEEGPALLRIFASYGLGMLLWRVVALPSGRLASLGNRPGTGPGHWSMPWIVPALLLIAPLLMPRIVPEAVAVAAALAAFAGAVVTSRHAAPGARTLGAAAWLGGISYPLYALHMPVMKIGFALGWPGAAGWVRLAGWVALGIAALIAADLAERCYDAPIRRRIRA